MLICFNLFLYSKWQKRGAFFERLFAFAIFVSKNPSRQFNFSFEEQKNKQKDGTLL